jgi:hypothetical protein
MSTTMSRRVPWRWEPQPEPREIAPHQPRIAWADAASAPPAFTETPNARNAIGRLAQLQVEQAHRQGLTDYTHADGLKGALRAAHRYDDRNS